MVTKGKEELLRKARPEEHNKIKILRNQARKERRSMKRKEKWGEIGQGLARQFHFLSQSPKSCSIPYSMVFAFWEQVIHTHAILTLPASYFAVCSSATESLFIYYCILLAPSETVSSTKDALTLPYFASQLARAPTSALCSCHTVFPASFRNR